MHQNPPKFKLHLPGCHSISNRTIHCDAHLQCVCTYVRTFLTYQTCNTFCLYWKYSLYIYSVKEVDKCEDDPSINKKNKMFWFTIKFTHPHAVKNHNKILWHLLLFENVGKRKPPWPKPASQVDLFGVMFTMNSSGIRVYFGEFSVEMGAIEHTFNNQVWGTGLVEISQISRSRYLCSNLFLSTYQLTRDALWARNRKVTGYSVGGEAFIYLWTDILANLKKSIFLSPHIVSRHEINDCGISFITYYVLLLIYLISSGQSLARNVKKKLISWIKFQ